MVSPDAFQCATRPPRRIQQQGQGHEQSGVPRHPQGGIGQVLLEILPAIRRNSPDPAGRNSLRLRPQLRVPDRQAVPHQSAAHRLVLRPINLRQRVVARADSAATRLCRFQPSLAGPAVEACAVRWQRAPCRFAAGSVRAHSWPARRHGCWSRSSADPPGGPALHGVRRSVREHLEPAAGLKLHASQICCCVWSVANGA